MSSYDDRTVANPDRTHIDGVATRRERDGDVDETRERPAVAEEVTQTTEDAATPAD